MDEENKHHIIKSTEENPFYIKGIFREGAIHDLDTAIILFIIFAYSLFYYLLREYACIYDPLFSLMIVCLCFLIVSLPLLAKHEIHMNNRFKFRSSIYNLSFDRKQTIVSLKNKNKQKWLGLLNKKVLNTNVFSLIMSNVLISVFMAIGYFFLLFYTLYYYNISSYEQLLIGLLFLVFSYSPYALLSYISLDRSTHILILHGKHKIKIYALNPEWLMERLIRK